MNKGEGKGSLSEVIDFSQIYNEDCISGCRRHVPDSCVDLLITDPPYGINAEALSKHYHRKEEYVLDGYIEVPQAEYEEFSRAWIREAARILRPGGSIYILSGYTNLRLILNALAETDLEEINHIIWKYNFGVYTKTKYVSSHYHILYYYKPPKRPTFNTYSFYGPDEKNGSGGSANYRHREDVWIINREYKPGKAKNKNELPTALLVKMIGYSSHEGDLVCDLFLGGFSTLKTALAMNRRVMGFEKSKGLFQHQMEELKRVRPASLLPTLRKPLLSTKPNQRKKWTADGKREVRIAFKEVRPTVGSKKEAIQVLCDRFGRGYFSILNVLDAPEGMDRSSK